MLTGEHLQLSHEQLNCDPSTTVLNTGQHLSAERLGLHASAATAWKYWHRHTLSLQHLDAAAEGTQTGQIRGEGKGSWNVLLSEKTDLPFDLQAQHCSSCFTAPEWNQELLTSMEVYKSLPKLCVLTI